MHLARLAMAAVAVSVLGGSCAGPTAVSDRAGSTASTTQRPGTPPAPPVPVDVAAAAAAAGVPMLSEEGAATHTHTRLRITAGTADVAVPSGLGIDAVSGSIGAHHTHDDSGLLHVESPRAGDTYTLAQLLQLWGIEPTPTGVCSAFRQSRCEVAVDGRPVWEARGLEVVLVDAATIHLEVLPVTVV